tara:strand:+ start:2440 stop:3294 length:855 start_codon:yes stop_codon:yes gene_type:complete
MEVIGKQSSELKLFDKSFSLDNTREHRHRIIISPYQVAGVIYGEDNKIYGLYRLPLKQNKEDIFTKAVSDVLRTNNWFNPPYKSVDIYYCGGRLTLVPEELYNPDETITYFKFNSRLSNEESVMSELLSGTNIQCIYSINKTLKTALEDRFTNLSIKHQFSLKLPFVLDITADKSPNVFIHLYSGNFQISIIENKELLLYNEYKYLRKEDFLYYCLNSMEQLGLNPEYTTLILAGNSIEMEEILKLMSEYIRTVKLLEFKPKLHNPSFLSQIKVHEQMYQLIGV